MKKLAALAALVVSAALVLTVVPVSAASASTPAKKKCPIALATDLGWDTSDPGFIRVAPQVTWKNCGGRIERVLVTTRILNADGTPAGEKTIAYFPATRNSAGSGTTSLYITTVGSPSLSEMVDGSSTTRYTVTACEAADSPGKQVVGAYYYTTAQALDAKGKVLVQKSGPKHLCGA